MHLRPKRRLKDGKEHCYWSIVESKRCAGGKVVQRQVLYLGEINDSQQEARCRVIEAFDEGAQQTSNWLCSPPIGRCPIMPRPMASRYGSGPCSCIGRGNGAHAGSPASSMKLELDRFWAARLPDSREGTCWSHILETLVCYRLIDPGSEWR